MNTIKNEEYLKEMTRLTKAKADMAELKVKERRGELVAISAVKKEWQENASHVRSKILSLPEIAPQLEGKSVSEIKRILAVKVNELLNEFAEEYR